jgi:hypothetical protein
MKKYIFIGFLILAVSMLFGCCGQTENSYDKSTQSSSFILNGNSKTVNYLLIETNKGLHLAGNWQAENNQWNASSKIMFSQDGKFQEKIYSNLTSELLASYQGSYTATNNILIVTLNSGDSYRFTYRLSGDYLQISQ